MNSGARLLNGRWSVSRGERGTISFHREEVVNNREKVHWRESAGRSDKSCDDRSVISFNVFAGRSTSRGKRYGGRFSYQPSVHRWEPDIKQGKRKKRINCCVTKVARYFNLCLSCDGGAEGYMVSLR